MMSRKIDTLPNHPAPMTGQELQQFVCALNWMRASLPAFKQVDRSTGKDTGKVDERGGGRKKQQVRAVKLSDAG